MMETDRVIEFAVTGRPQGKQRPRVVKGGRQTFTPEKTRRYEARVTALALQAKQASKKVLPPYRVEIDIVWEDARHPDIDNVSKCILDGMNRVVYEDDRDVTQLETKVVGICKKSPGVTVRVLHVGDIN